MLNQNTVGDRHEGSANAKRLLIANNDDIECLCMLNNITVVLVMSYKRAFIATLCFVTPVASDRGGQSPRGCGRMHEGNIIITRRSIYQHMPHKNDM